MAVVGGVYGGGRRHICEGANLATGKADRDIKQFRRSTREQLVAREGLQASWSMPASIGRRAVQLHEVHDVLMGT